MSVNAYSDKCGVGPCVVDWNGNYIAHPGDDHHHHDGLSHNDIENYIEKNCKITAGIHYCGSSSEVSCLKSYINALKIACN